jgi:hypothetical protein
LYIDAQDFYIVTPDYCRNKYQFSTLPSGIVVLAASTNRILQIDTYIGSLVGSHTFTIRPLYRYSDTIIDDIVTVNL